MGGREGGGGWGWGMGGDVVASQPGSKLLHFQITGGQVLAANALGSDLSVSACPLPELVPSPVGTPHAISSFPPV